MNGVNPEIMNRLRAEGGIRSESITPVYHLPDIPKPREPQIEESIEELKPPKLRKTQRGAELFRSALRGLRGGEYDSPTET